MPSSNKPYSNILELIGNTPLIRLNEVTKNFKGEYFTKFEGFNPGHSNKDRIALHIINQAEEKGILSRGSTIIETTSGNTGFSLALVSLLKGYKCILAVSSKASKDKINMMKCLGAEIYVWPSNVESDDPRSYYEVAKRLNKEIKGSVYINQYFITYARNCFGSDGDSRSARTSDLKYSYKVCKWRRCPISKFNSNCKFIKYFYSSINSI